MTTPEYDDEEVFLVPVADDVVLAFPIESRKQSQQSDWINIAEFIRAVGPLIAKALEKSGIGSANYYELSAESQKQLQGAKRDYVGDYFRGVIRQPKGQFKHSLQLREVKASAPPSAIDPMQAAMVAQMAAVQVQLSRIEDAVGDLSTTVDAILEFLEVQQRAGIEVALDILREVHERAKATGTITEDDWHRIMSAHVETEFGKQSRAVRSELASKLAGIQFGVSPREDAKTMKQVKPERVGELVELHRMLLGGLRGWYELMMLRKYLANELTQSEVNAISNRLNKLNTEHEQLLQLLDAAIQSSRLSKPRRNVTRLFSDGLVIGGENDKRNLKVVTDGRKVLQRVQRSVRPVLAEGRHWVLLEPAAPDVQ